MLNFDSNNLSYHLDNVHQSFISPVCALEEYIDKENSSSSILELVSQSLRQSLNNLESEIKRSRELEALGVFPIRDRYDLDSLNKEELEKVYKEATDMIQNTKAFAKLVKEKINNFN